MSVHFTQASQFLNSIDKDWAFLIQSIGPCTLSTRQERDPYEALVRAVAYQQLSIKVGNVILARFLSLFASFPSPEQLLTTPFEDLRKCGFSSRKIETIQGIAQAALNGQVPIRAVAEGLSDQALIEQLTTIKGIGRWTVEMLLIFCLERLDVLPADDLGVREGYKRLKGLSIAPNAKALAELAQAWQPYRTIAAWYLWQVPKETPNK